MKRRRFPLCPICRYWRKARNPQGRFCHPCSRSRRMLGLTGIDTIELWAARRARWGMRERQRNGELLPEVRRD